MAIKSRVIGLGSLKTKLNALGDGANSVAATVLYQESEKIMIDAKRLTPVLTGDLRNSGFVRPPLLRKTGVSVELGFGGVAAPYAVFVHERVDLKHNVGQAKFLEAAFVARKDAVVLRLTEELKRFYKLFKGR